MRKAGRVRRGVQRDEEVRRRARMEEKAEGGGERERENSRLSRVLSCQRG